MLGLPKSTELNKQLPKKAIYAKFKMNTSSKERMDADVSRITIVNELSPERINIAVGEKITSFYVLLVSLKKKNFDERNIVTISKLIPQNILFILECGQEAKLAIYYTKLIQTEWRDKESLTIDLKGLNFDKVRENIVKEIGNIKIEQGNSLDEQIVIDEKKIKLQKEIDRVDKSARKEKQPKKKLVLANEVKRLTKQLEKLG